MIKKRISYITIFFVFFSGIALRPVAQVPAAVNSTLVHAKQGDVVRLDNFLTEKFPLLDYKKIVAPGPQFLISDDPEYIRVPEAIAMQENVQPGTVRLYLYNVNGVKEPAQMPRKITAVIKNTGRKPMMLRMLRYASQPPTGNYFLAGKYGLRDFLSADAKTLYTLTIQPGEAKAIDPKLEKQVADYDELVHGFYEFLIDQPAQVSIVQTSPQSSGAAALQRIKTVTPPRGINAGRGLFGVANYLVKVKDTVADNTVTQLILADGDKDPWVEGTEGSTGMLTRNAGNYGVLYHIDMKWKAAAGKGLALVTWNARAADNKWCGGMANTMDVSNGKFKAGVIQLPANELRIKAAPEAVLVQIFVPDPAKEIQEINMVYSPPGASCLPTPLVFIPVDLN